MKIYYENVNTKYYYIRCMCIMINLMIFLEKCDHDTLELLKITKAFMDILLSKRTDTEFYRYSVGSYNYILVYSFTRIFLKKSFALKYLSGNQREYIYIYIIKIYKTQIYLKKKLDNTKIHIQRKFVDY